MKNIEILQVTRENYHLFDALAHYRATGAVKSINSDDDFTTAFSELANENFYVYAAKYKDIFVGYACIIYIPKIGAPRWEHGYIYLDDLYVMPSYRKQGIATSLLEKLDYHAAEHNATITRLYVSTANDAAVNAYTKAGYKLAGDTAVRMEKKS